MQHMLKHFITRNRSKIFNQFWIIFPNDNHNLQRKNWKLFNEKIEQPHKLIFMDTFNGILNKVKVMRNSWTFPFIQRAQNAPCSWLIHIGKCLRLKEWSKAALEFQHFFPRQIKCRGNYMKIHFASALPRQCFCRGW